MVDTNITPKYVPYGYAGILGCGGYTNTDKVKKAKE